MKFYDDYCMAARSVFRGIEPDLLLTGALLLSAIVLSFVGLYFDLIFGVLLAVLAFDIAIGYPIYVRDKRRASIEASLPDVLSHIATTLKAGSTIDTALREIAGADYGPISFEMKRMLREIREGKTFEEAFTGFGERSDSELIRRSVKVIISAKRTGGGLTSVLSSISDDMRENSRLREERKAKTTSQVLFILIAANLIAPFIFGIVSAIILFLGSVSGEVPPLFETLLFYFKGFLVLSAVFSAFAASLIKDGKLTGAVIYTPIFLIVTYTIFTVVSAGARIFFGV